MMQGRTFQIYKDILTASGRNMSQGYSMNQVGTEQFDRNVGGLKDKKEWMAEKLKVRTGTTSEVFKKVSILVTIKAQLFHTKDGWVYQLRWCEPGLAHDVW